MDQLIENIDDYNYDNEKDNSSNNLMLKDKSKLYPKLSIDEVKLNLKTIGMVREFDKLCIKGNFLEIDHTTVVKRTINNLIYDGYSRVDVIDFIIHLTEECLSISDNILNEQNYNASNKFFKDNINNTIKSLADEIRLSIIGLRNIKLTYIKDSAIQSRLELVIEKLENRVKQINEIDFNS